jgi:hypothetical protein
MTDVQHTSRRVSRKKELGALSELLLECCPETEDGPPSLPRLAKHLGISYQYVYRWVKEDRVPPNFVRHLTELSAGRVAIHQFHDYVF